MRIRQITRHEVSAIREQISAKQKHICPLCGSSLKQKRPAMDHDHETGFLRGVLCVNCNGMEGKIKHYATRAKGNLTFIEWLKNLMQYYEYHSTPRYPLLHPEHKTEEQKRLDRNKKARQRRAKAKKDEGKK